MFVDLFLQTVPQDWAEARTAQQLLHKSKRATEKTATAPSAIANLAPPLGLQKTILHLLEIGYDGFAISITISGDKLHRFQPFTVDFTEIQKRIASSDLPQSQMLRVHDPVFDLTGTFFQASRLTIETTSMSQLLDLNQSVLISKFYDVIAVRPGSQDEFSYLCKESDTVDVICIDGHCKLPFDPKLKDVEIALKRGVCFELSLQSSLRDPTTRRHFIANGSKIARLTRGKALMLNSGATNFLECRSPQDLASLGIMLGLTFEHARNATSAVWRRVIEHGGKTSFIQSLQLCFSLVLLFRCASCVCCSETKATADQYFSYMRSAHKKDDCRLRKMIFPFP